MKIGDVVEYNENWPLMTVAGFRGDMVVCQWFVGNELYQQPFKKSLFRKTILISLPPDIVWAIRAYNDG